MREYNPVLEDPSVDGMITFTNVITDTEDGLTWYGPGPQSYGIRRGAGEWINPDYQQLKITFATGIVIDGGTYYGKSGTVLQPNGGNVGIGMYPSYALDVTGDIRTSTYFRGDGSLLTNLPTPSAGGASVATIFLLMGA